MLRTIIFPLLLSLLLVGSARAVDEFAEQRHELIDTIGVHVASTSRYLGKDALAPAVLDSMMKVPRHEFVPDALRDQAYANRPLPIGHGQTISQPYIVAIMTDLLQPEDGDRVLEVGTGSGYQAAVMAELVRDVYTIEIIEPLARSAEQRLERLKYDNVHVRHADGYHGWPDKGPFDAIIVTAAAGHVPPPLIEQLKPGGHMIIPVGSRFLTQQLVLISKDGDGETSLRQILPVRFVPLTGDH